MPTWPPHSHRLVFRMMQWFIIEFKFNTSLYSLYSMSSDEVYSKSYHIQQKRIPRFSYYILYYLVYYRPFRVKALARVPSTWPWYSSCCITLLNYRFELWILSRVVHIKYCMNYVNTTEYYTRHLRSLCIYRDLWQYTTYTFI